VAALIVTLVSETPYVALNELSSCTNSDASASSGIDTLRELSDFRSLLMVANCVLSAASLASLLVLAVVVDVNCASVAPTWATIGEIPTNHPATATTIIPATAATTQSLSVFICLPLQSS
jgi:hypothetical protein